MSTVDLVPLVDEGLGNSAYLVDVSGMRQLAATEGTQVLASAAGHRDLAVLEGGPQDWTTTTGRSLEEGE
ncbi:hypothetical protein J2S53_000858 [Actinopolyspora lacussalsi]|nr:hypothetical protein [Actinopolyspora lacussalsi]